MAYNPGWSLRLLRNCPPAALNVWEMMLDDIPGVENPRREHEARIRTVLVDIVAAVDKACLTSGVIQSRVQSSTKLHVFHGGIVEFTRSIQWP